MVIGLTHGMKENNDSTPERETQTWRNERRDIRLDRALQARLPQYSRSWLQQRIQEGAAAVDGRVWRWPGRRLRGGEWLRLSLPAAPEKHLPAQSMPLNWLHEDDQLAVLDKPAGLVVQPGAGRREGTLVNALFARWPELREFSGDPERAGIVHRLDKETSGLLIVARTEVAQAALQAQFAARTIMKRYLALVERVPPEKQGIIDTPIQRDRQHRHRFRVERGGKRALSHFRCLEGPLQGGRALLEIRPETGRTHQIRVQMAHLGCPLVGDRLYGYRKRRLPLTRHFLHASEITFVHPKTAEKLTFQAPLPADLANLLREIGGHPERLRAP